MMTSQIGQFLRTPTMRLAAIHLAIIMSLSIGFSIVFYHTSDRQFARPAAPPARSESMLWPSDRFDSELRRVMDERFNQTRQALLVRLVWINIVTLLVGGGISYLLARWSLRPIEEAMEAQVQFVSDASHELRTPLTVLQTTNEIALRKKKLPVTEARTLIAHNVEEVKKLRDLSNMLLDLIRSEHRAVRESAQLQDVASEAMTAVVPAAQAKNIAIEDTVPDVAVDTNSAVLVRIIVILLDNAIKYSPVDTQVTLAAHQDGDKVLLEVADQGIGIRASDMPMIFRRFYRADKSRSASVVHGYGLGLAIAEKLAEQIGAKITVESVVGEGSTFRIELPF